MYDKGKNMDVYGKVLDFGWFYFYKSGPPADQPDLKNKNKILFFDLPKSQTTLPSAKNPQNKK